MTYSNSPAKFDQANGFKKIYGSIPQDAQIIVYKTNDLGYTFHKFEKIINNYGIKYSNAKEIIPLIDESATNYTYEKRGSLGKDSRAGPINSVGVENQYIFYWMNSKEASNIKELITDDTKIFIATQIPFTYDQILKHFKDYGIYALEYNRNYEHTYLVRN